MTTPDLSAVLFILGFALLVFVIMPATKDPQ